MLLVMLPCTAQFNLIGRWQSAPIWDRFELMTYEVNFRDSVHVDARVVVDNTHFCDGEVATRSMSGTYQMHDSLCLLTADYSTFSSTSPSFSMPMRPDSVEVDSFVIAPSKNSEDVMALIDHLNRDVFVLYRQK